MQVLWTEAEKARAKELGGISRARAASVINKEFHSGALVRTGRAIQMMRHRNYPNKVTPRWDIEKETELRALIRHPDKLSARQIGLRMDVSRMAVIGKCRRMGLSLPLEQGVIWLKPDKHVHKREPQRFDGISDTPEPLALDTSERASHCQYIFNDDTKNPDFCKQPQTHDSYCQEHFELCCPGQVARQRIGWR